MWEGDRTPPPFLNVPRGAPAGGQHSQSEQKKLRLCKKLCEWKVAHGIMWTIDFTVGVVLCTVLGITCRAVGGCIVGAGLDECISRQRAQHTVVLTIVYHQNKTVVCASGQFTRSSCLPPFGKRRMRGRQRKQTLWLSFMWGWFTFTFWFWCWSLVNVFCLFVCLLVYGEKKFPFPLLWMCLASSLPTFSDHPVSPDPLFSASYWAYYIVQM